MDRKHGRQTHVSHLHCRCPRAHHHQQEQALVAAPGSAVPHDARRDGVLGLPSSILGAPVVLGARGLLVPLGDDDDGEVDDPSVSEAS